MAWMWWLLAPVASTVLGASVIGWWARRGVRGTGRRHDPMAAHHALLDALPQPRAGDAPPVTMRLLDRTLE